MKHTLEITSDPEFGRECEVIHPSECPMGIGQWGEGVWKCQEGWYLDEFGLPDHLTQLEPGNYQVEFWVESRPNYTGVMEHEYGIDLVSE